jgi:hypothetical protein
MSKYKRTSLAGIETIQKDYKKELEKLQYEEVKSAKDNNNSYKFFFDRSLLKKTDKITHGSLLMSEQFLKNFIIENFNNVLLIDKIKIFQDNSFKQFLENNRNSISEIINAIKNNYKYITGFLILDNIHANMLFIENNDKIIIEYYEPHGSYNINIDISAMIKKLSKLLEYTFKKSVIINQPYNFCPLLGLQHKQEFYSDFLYNIGFCQTWCIFYIYERLLNLHLTSKEVLKMLTAFTPEQLKDIIVNFTDHIISDKKNISEDILHFIDNDVDMIHNIYDIFPYDKEFDKILDEIYDILEYFSIHNLKKLSDIYFRAYLYYINKINIFSRNVLKNLNNEIDEIIKSNYNKYLFNDMKGHKFLYSLEKIFAFKKAAESKKILKKKEIMQKIFDPNYSIDKFNLEL